MSPQLSSQALTPELLELRPMSSFTFTMTLTLSGPMGIGAKRGTEPRSCEAEFSALTTFLCVTERHR